MPPRSRNRSFGSLGDKVGDAYIEVHAEVDKGSVAKAQKELEATALKNQKALNTKLVRNDREAIEKAHINALQIERRRQADITKLHVQALREQNRRIEVANKERIKLETKVHSEINNVVRKRYKDGGVAGISESIENVASVLPGQLEKLLRNPYIAAGAVALGSAVGVEVVGGIGAAVAGATAAGVLGAGIFAAVKKDGDLQRAGAAIGKQLTDGFSQTALNQLKPAILESFSFLDKTHFGDKIATNFQFAFAQLATKLPGLTSNIAETIDGITDSIGKFVAQNPQIIDQLGNGFKQIGNAAESVFNVLKENGPAIGLFLGDMTAVVSGAVRGFGKIVQIASNIRNGVQDTLAAVGLAEKRKDLGGVNGGTEEQLAARIRSLQASGAALQKEREEAVKYGDATTGIDANIKKNSDDVTAALAVQTQKWNEKRTAQLEAAAATQTAGLSDKDAAAAAKALTALTKEQNDTIKSNIDLQKQKADAVYAAQKAAIAYKQAEVDLTTAFKGNNDTISLNTQKGREHRAALIDQFKAARDQAQAIYETTGRADLANKKFKELTDKTIANTGAVGKNKEEMIKLRGQYSEFQNAPNIDKKIEIYSNLNELLYKLAHIPDAHARLILAQETIQMKNPMNRTGGQQKATGGHVSGPGTGTSDSIPARLSNGEYVIKASSAKKIGTANLNAMNSSGQVMGFARGGGPGHGRGSTRGQVNQFNSLNAQIASLSQVIAQQTQALTQYTDQLKSSADQFKSYISLTGLNATGTGGDLITELRNKKQKTGEFQSNLKNLKNRGLSTAALQQVAESGPDSPLAQLLAGGVSDYDIGLINNLLTGEGAYSQGVASTIFPQGPGTAASLKRHQKMLAARKRKAAKLKPVKARGATISYAGGRTTALFSAKELQQQQLKQGTYVTVMIDGKEVRAIVKQEQQKTVKKSNRNIKSGRR